MLHNVYEWSYFFLYFVEEFFDRGNYNIQGLLVSKVKIEGRENRSWIIIIIILVNFTVDRYQTTNGMTRSNLFNILK